ncbi:DNA/RNA nuclease SfsA [Sedimenticola selenatireducens]|uniref:DNA/RNA nuclease SfsA n=1 Tax=Sedimenticola selenatireducens TaxID=191960 RepID=UPI0004AF6041|nr:DNA/RNA nuclease SfsA [Sedimenticola selenatireducens]
MKLPDLLEGRLIRRYKRFLADVRLTDGSEVIAHCPNTGSMKNCAEPGSRVWLQDVNSPKRKLRYRWELVEVEGRYLACINTARANDLVREAIIAERIEALNGYSTIQSERPYGNEGSRIDLLLTEPGLPDCFVEVKNVTLRIGDGLGTFPDAVTDRGRKHLRELTAVVKGGGRGVLFFNVAHSGIQRVEPAWDIDPAYAEALVEEVEAGVEVLAYQVEFAPGQLNLRHLLPFRPGTPFLCT